MKGERMFYRLKEEVIDPGFCVLCGSCSSFCDRIELDYDEGTPKLVKPCVVGCSICYDQCPMRQDFDSVQVFGKTMRDPFLGHYREIKAVQATDKAMEKGGQDGGAVTAILSAILERGKIDAAIVVERDAVWKPLPRIITSKEDLFASQGSKYSPSPNIESLAEVFKGEDIKSIAVVDVGCHIRGIRNIEFNLLYNAGFSPYSDLKIYTIGLFCVGSFYHNRLMSILKTKPDSINKMVISKGKLNVQSNEERLLPVWAVKDSTMPSCCLCPDVTAENADLSIGSFGSPDGYSTVIVRNLQGWGMLRDAVQRGYVEADKSLVDREALTKAAMKKQNDVKVRISTNLKRKRKVPGFILSRPLPQ
ncbi:MAG: Coenzyme F420 hydrogenase/dehydrogenase, beta subunit C-terminal domain [Candidatus Hydrothermarchaeales archaeon]